MFYSQFFLTKKGALATIWVAAHSQQKLKKEQVKQTNIPHSVDKILVDVPVVTYRILGFLLLGVVRIYSKKVDYLFHDSTNVLTEIRQFSVGKSDDADVDTMRAPYSSITLPESFELDAFDLEVFEGGFGGHVKPREEITLQDDVSEKERIGQHSFDKYRFDDDGVEFEDGSAIYTSLENIHSPCLVQDDMLASPSENVRNFEMSMEKILGNTFSLDDFVNPPILGENEEEIELVRSFDQENHTDGTQPVVSEMMSEEIEDYMDDVNLFDEEHYTSPKSPCSISIDATPKSNVPYASGDATPEFMAVRTPATKERSRIFLKRKCLFDDAIVISNREFKQSISDSSGLLRKRKKVQKISNFPQKFFEPLIPSFVIDLQSLIFQKKLKISERVEAVRTPTKTDILKSASVQSSPDQETVSPSTPVTHSPSLRYEDNHWSADSDCVGPSNSFDSVDKEPSPSEDRGVDVTSMNEEFNFGKGDDKENDDWSVRTREFMRYLHGCFLTRKKRGEDEVLNLSQALQGNSKKESASLFYALLVLKNRGFINVRQDSAYDDIFVTGTTTLKQACEADRTQCS